jgi:glutathione S-transferase
MKVFGFPLSPFVRKVHLAAAEKGIAVEAVAANPRDPSPEFAAASPFHKIPALQDGDFNLADSTAIVTYFDALVPEPSMTPGDARAKARAIWFEEMADTIFAAAGGKVVFNRFVAPKVLGIAGDEAAAEQGARELEPIYAYLESVAPAEGWLAGDGFGVGDIAVASVIRTLAYAGVEPHPAKHPRLIAWYDRVKARPSWQQVAAAEAKVMGG